jgi:hypothetical protein
VLNPPEADFAALNILPGSRPGRRKSPTGCTKIGPVSIPRFADRLKECGNPNLPEEPTMRYLCMICYEQQTLDSLSQPEFDALVAESLAYDDELRSGGHYLYSGALQSVQKAATLRIQSGKVLVSDGPFAETKEHLGGFIVIEAGDLDEAIRLASKIPPARLGSVEVRPIQELDS